jgi:hypothetical protein
MAEMTKPFWPKSYLLPPSLARAALAFSLVIGQVGDARAKVLRNKTASPTVLVFKGADELRRFNELASSAANSDAVDPLLACRVPQGSGIQVLGSGYRTAFVKVIDGPALGCQGTVPIGRVQDQ